MATKSPSKNRRQPQPHALHKPRGVIHPRMPGGRTGALRPGVRRLRKARSRMMLADFYGRVLLEPTTVEHNRSDFETAVTSVRRP